MRNIIFGKIMSIVLAIVLLAVLVMSVSALGLPIDPIEPDVTDPNIKSGVCGVGDKLSWSFNTKTGVLTVFGNGAMKNRTASQSVPWKSFLSSIKTIVIFPGVTTVGNYAFYSCTSATSVIFCGTEAQWNGVVKGTNWSPASAGIVKMHSFADGVCDYCGLVCEHEDEHGDLCSVCGTTLKKIMLGDVNGDELITNADVLAIYRYIYNSALYPLDVIVADVNKDGVVTNADVLAIYRYIYNPVLYPLG